MGDLSDLQRQPAPFVGDRWHQRVNPAGSAGAVTPLFRRTIANGVDNEATRYNGAVNDDQIQRGNTPWYPLDNMHGAGTGMVNWTAAGPPRPELHMRQQFALRVMAGTSRTRALPSPVDPTIGLHSTPPKPREMGNVQRIKAKAPTIRTGRQNRLSAARYSGQSYSQTTRGQGAR